MTGKYTDAGHIDFASFADEVKCCARCRQVFSTSRGTSKMWCIVLVTPRGPFAIGGLIGVCIDCLSNLEPRYNEKAIIRMVKANWRRTAPKFIQLIPRRPIQLVVRGHYDDAALARLIRETIFQVLPAASRRKIIEYVCDTNQSTATGKGMRFEALRRWPGKGVCAGMNMDQGHAIRLHAPTLRKLTRESISEVIAHELAHTEQYAEKLPFINQNARELDVEERLQRWGVKQRDFRHERRLLTSQCNTIIQFAEDAKAIIETGKAPSGNFAAETDRQLSNAQVALQRAKDRWQGLE